MKLVREGNPCSSSPSLSLSHQATHYTSFSPKSIDWQRFPMTGNTMDSRGRKRPEEEEQLPADKRACSSSEFRPPAPSEATSPTSPVASSSLPPSPPPPPSQASAEPSAVDSEMESTSSARSCDSDDDPDEHVDDEHPSERYQFKRIVAWLENEGEQLAALTELCELLCFCADDRVRNVEMDKLAPKLVELAGGDGDPEIILLSTRALTYLCDSFPRSSVLLVRDGVIPILCGRLSAIEYLDVAEQCLQALEKISHNQPIPCLQTGAIMSCLSYIDFFSTSIQRIALSAVANMCTKLPLDCSSFVLEAIPTLCAILQYEDGKLVETAAACLTRITQSFNGSAEMLNELCNNGLIEQCAKLISSSDRMTLGKTTLDGLIGLLAILASCSHEAVKTLLELNISSVLKGFLNAPDVSLGTGSHISMHSNQIHEVLNLLNQLIPTVISHDKDIQLAKAKILEDQPRLLHHFAMDILPVAIQVVSSSTNLSVCYGCISIINKIVYYSTPDVLLDVLKDINVSSFLASILTHNDHHVMISALRTAHILLQKHSDIFLNLFVKEGVAFAIDTLQSLEDNIQSVLHQSTITNHSSIPSHHMDEKKICRCLCYAFDLCQSTSSQTECCKLEKDAVVTLAKDIKATYFTSSSNSEIGSTEILCKLRNYCSLLNDNVDKSSGNGYSVQNEEYLSQILKQIISEVNGGEPMSTFEFVESGIVKSFIHYLSNGRYIQQGLNKQASPNHDLIVRERFQTFAKISLSKQFQNREGTALALLVRKLQSALSSLDNFPVITSLPYRPRNVYVHIPLQHSTMHPCFKVLFVRDERESVLSDYSVDVLNVEPSSSLDAIERFLWPKIRPKNAEYPSELTEKSRVETTDSLSSVDSKASEDPILGSICVVDRSPQEGQSEFMAGTLNAPSVLSEGTRDEDLHLLPEDDAGFNVRKLTIENTSGLPSLGKGHDKGGKFTTSHGSGHVERKLVFYLDDKELDGSLTLFQAILQQQLSVEGPDMVVGPNFWNEVCKLTYKRAELNICDSEVSSEDRNKKEVSSDDPGKEIFFGHVSPSPTTLSWLKDSFFSSLLAAELPCELAKSSPSYDILFMLKVLEGLNRFTFHLLSNERCNAFAQGSISEFCEINMMASAVPQIEFLSNKLTEKLEQQMRDPLSVSPGSMPAWCSQLIAACPFLFSFTSRCKYFRLSTFSSSQIPQNPNPQWSGHTGSVNDRRSYVTAFSRRKFRVDRSHILESAAKMMALYARSKAVLEVEYNEEVGTGLGPTMEFYTLVSHEFQKVDLGLWRGDHGFSASHVYLGTSPQVGVSGYLDPSVGLFPSPWSNAMSSSNGIHFSKVIEKFTLLGQLVAKALQDGRVFDLPLSKAFYKLILDQELDIYDIQSFDPELGKTLLEFLSLVHRKKFLEGKSTGSCDIHFRDTRIEDLCIDFTLPGYSDYLLASGSNSKMVNDMNLGEYVSLVVDATVRSGISRQVEAFKIGFNQVFPMKSLQVFSEDDLERLLCGEQDTWALGELLDNIKFDHGYTVSSPPAINFLEIIQEFERDQRRAFLQFVTGAPQLPPGGLAALSPKLTVVRKNCSDSVDMDLPSVMTCANYLKLPPYSSKERTRERLLYAITEGQGSFHLS